MSWFQHRSGFGFSPNATGLSDFPQNARMVSAASILALHGGDAMEWILQT